jgi:SAM-dependent MidA family methyltransferase
MPASPPLPPLDDESLAHASRVAGYLRGHIQAAGGWIGFDDFMSQALYAPGLGYYAAGSHKLASPDDTAASGDFITAPQLTPLFARTLAGPVSAVLQAAGSTEVLEFGAGTGALAAGLIQALQEQGVDVQYRILEVSADLRERQREKLASHGGRVQWLDALPTAFSGCVIANEVLDAMPVKLFRWDDAGTVLERGVAIVPESLGTADASARQAGASRTDASRTDAPPDFHWEDRPAPEELALLVSERMPPLSGYVSEINLQGEAFMREMGQWLRHGAAFLLDYGFPRHEYYHPQRAGGTLMCHLRHTAHDDPLVYPGAQDITAHVDFTAMADAALEGGLDVLGYTSQARFLINAGLGQWLQALQQTSPAAYARSLNAVQKLISEAEMGELFKVLAVGKGLDAPPPGFERGDRLGML